jgi:hypothetical protein
MRWYITSSIYAKPQFEIFNIRRCTKDKIIKFGCANSTPLKPYQALSFSVAQNTMYVKLRYCMLQI